MNSIAALIITKNEEMNIRDCLESIKWVQEIIVVDAYSSDKSGDICKKYTDKFYQRKFDNFASQRNFGLDRIKSDWVLVLDADERVTPELQEEINTVLRAPKADAYKLPLKNFFLGKWIKYCGWYPDYTLRLFKRDGVRYSGMVHEGLNISGTIHKLKNPLTHYTCRNLAHYLDKMNHYTTLAAEDMYKAGKRKGIAYSVLRFFLEFIKKYIVQGGFLAGTQGLVLAAICSHYTFLKYAKLWEKDNEKG